MFLEIIFFCCNLLKGVMFIVGVVVLLCIGLILMVVKV